MWKLWILKSLDDHAKTKRAEVLKRQDASPKFQDSNTYNCKLHILSIKLALQVWQQYGFAAYNLLSILPYSPVTESNVESILLPADSLVKSITSSPWPSSLWFPPSPLAKWSWCQWRWKTPWHYHQPSQSSHHRFSNSGWKAATPEIRNAISLLTILRQFVKMHIFLEPAFQIHAADIIHRNYQHSCIVRRTA